MQMDSLVPPQSLPDVASPPLLEHLLFEEPWLLVAGVFAVSIAAAFMVYRAAKNRQQQLVAGILVVEAFFTSAVLIGLAMYTVTDREAIDDRTREAVAAVADWDAQAFEPMLADSVRTVFFQARNGWDREELLAWIGGRSEPYAVRSYTIKDVRTEIGPAGGAVTRVEVSVQPEAWDRPMLFICMFEWVQQERASNPHAGMHLAESHGWKIDTIRPLWIQGFGDLRDGGR